MVEIEYGIHWYKVQMLPHAVYKRHTLNILRIKIGKWEGVKGNQMQTLQEVVLPSYHRTEHTMERITWKNGWHFKVIKLLNHLEDIRTKSLGT